MNVLPRLRWSAWRERVGSSLFVVPVLFLGAGVVLAEVLLIVDERLGDSRRDLPLTLSSTPDGARAVLSTVATATVTVAGIAFSISLLVFQLASSQYSPRVIHSLFRDPFNKRVIGLVVGTFSYCLVVLRAVRGPLEEGGDATVPAVSVAVAVVLGLASLLGIVAFINHSAHSMEVSELLQRITDAGIEQVTSRDGVGLTDGLDELDDGDRAVPPDGAGWEVRARAHGWLQQVDTAGLLASLDPGSFVRMETTPGRYLTPGSPLCTIWPDPGPAARDRLESAVRRAAHVGRTRTMQQDVAYGLRQLADVAVRALSPGVNDPTTAQDAIFHLAALLQCALDRPEPVPRRDDRGSVVLPAEDRSHRTLVSTAFDEVRRDAATRPTVCTYLLEALHLVHRSLDAGAPARPELERQAALVVAGCEAAGALAEDLGAVRAAHARRFGPAVGGGLR